MCTRTSYPSGCLTISACAASSAFQSDHARSDPEGVPTCPPPPDTPPFDSPTKRSAVSPDGGLPSAFPANGDGLFISAFRGPSKNRRAVRNPFEALEPAAAPDSPFGTHPPSGWKADSQESFPTPPRRCPQPVRPHAVEKSLSVCQLAGLAARVPARRGGLPGPRVWLSGDNSLAPRMGRLVRVESRQKPRFVVRERRKRADVQRN